MTPPDSDGVTPEADRESRGRRVRPVLLVVVALVVTMLAVAAWIGVRGWLADRGSHLGRCTGGTMDR